MEETTDWKSPKNRKVLIVSAITIVLLLIVLFSVTGNGDKNKDGSVRDVSDKLFIEPPK